MSKNKIMHQKSEKSLRQRDEVYITFFMGEVGNTIQIVYKNVISILSIIKR